MNKNKGETMSVEECIKGNIKYNTGKFFNHFGRYYYAAKKLNISKKDVVMDASCGEGYGSYCLSKVAGTVWGMDVNEKYLETATRLFDEKNLNFRTYDEMYDHLTVDKVVCIETFEHISKEKIDGFLYRLQRNLKSEGSMFLTVPISNDCPSDYNEWHLNEPSLNTMYKMLSEYFPIIKFETDTFVNTYGKNMTYAIIVCEGKRWNRRPGDE